MQEKLKPIHEDDRFQFSESFHFLTFPQLFSWAIVHFYGHEIQNTKES